MFRLWVPGVRGYSAAWAQGVPVLWPCVQGLEQRLVCDIRYGMAGVLDCFGFTYETVTVRSRLRYYGVSALQHYWKKVWADGIWVVLKFSRQESHIGLIFRVPKKEP